MAGLLLRRHQPLSTLRATPSRRQRRVTRAARVEVLVAEAAVGVGLPLQAEAQRDDPRRPPLLLLPPRLRTRPPAGRTSRIGNDRRNGSHWGAVSLCAAANCYSAASRKNHARVAHNRIAIAGN